MKKRYLTSREVTEQLQITPATLYAYVSRGLIRSEMSPEDTRQRRYLAEDVQRLLDRKAQRRDPAQAVQQVAHQTAQQALFWGEPVMSSALTLITEGELYYRGRKISELVTSASFEEVCGLLWLDDPIAGLQVFTESTQALSPEVAPSKTQGSSLIRMQIALAEMAEYDMQAFDHTPQNIARIGVRIIRRMVEVVIGKAPDDHESIASTLAEAWGLSSDHLLQAALILWADHELNVSAFTARTIASADASPYQAVIGALAALQGYRHGGATQRVETMMQTFAAASDLQGAMRRWMQGGQPLAGFGHHLYPDGDPRAKILLDLLRASPVSHPELEIAEQVMAFAQQTTGQQPNMDFAIVLLQRMFEFPTDASLMLFAIGRTAGWIAHIIEQYETDTLIRPRATYTGRLPNL